MFGVLSWAVDLSIAGVCANLQSSIPRPPTGSMGEVYLGVRCAIISWRRRVVVTGWIGLYGKEIWDSGMGARGIGDGVQGREGSIGRCGRREGVFPFAGRRDGAAML
jgi:hypothetical protein